MNHERKMNKTIRYEVIELIGERKKTWYSGTNETEAYNRYSQIEDRSTPVQMVSIEEYAANKHLQQMRELFKAESQRA